MTDTNKVAQYVANWQDERNGAALYRAISEVEKNPQLKSVYQRLAEAEEKHSGFWEAKLRAAGQLLPSFKLNWRMRTLIFLARRFGPAFVLPGRRSAAARKITRPVAEGHHRRLTDRAGRQPHRATRGPPPRHRR